MAQPLATAAGSNLTPNHFLELYRELKTAQREIDAGTGRKRAILKRAKSGGVDLDALKLLENLAKLDPDKSEMRLRNVARYSEWVGRPVGFQPTLFSFVAESGPSESALGEHTEFLADDAGYAAGYRGDDIDTNPHKPGTPTFVRWRAGWHKGQGALVSVKLAAGQDAEPVTPATAPDAPDEDEQPAPPPRTEVRSGRRKKGGEQRAAA